MKNYNGKNGKTWKLNDKPFAAGGEGDIYEVFDDSMSVAKIYKDEKCTTDRERKILTMINIKPIGMEQYAWPCDILYENGEFKGYIMPKVSDKENLRNIVANDKRECKPWTLYIAIAKNLASAVHNVHEIGQVVGDLNPENILVNPTNGLVTMVDTDSYHITDEKGNVHRCEVGMLEFIAVELQGKNLRSGSLPTFTKESDLFSMAILIFSLLMNGSHPFACKAISGSSSAFQPIDNISSGTCAYFDESSVINIDIPRYAPKLDSLPIELQNLFKRAFIDGHKNASSRPTAEEFYNALEILETNIKTCGENSSHLYYCNATECPWCKVADKMKKIFS